MIKIKSAKGSDIKGYIAAITNGSALDHIYPPTGVCYVPQNDFEDREETTNDFNDIYRRKHEYYAKSNIEPQSFGIVPANVEDNNVIGKWYFCFIDNVHKGYYFSARGHKGQAIKLFEKVFRNLDYILMSEEEFNTPDRYTKVKPSDVYKKWII